MGTTPREIGARVKALREFRKVPAVELAKRAGITKQPSQAMNRYEAGRRGIGNELLVRFADLLQAPVEWLMRGGADGPIPEPVLTTVEEPMAKRGEELTMTAVRGLLEELDVPDSERDAIYAQAGEWSFTGGFTRQRVIDFWSGLQAAARRAAGQAQGAARSRGAEDQGGSQQGRGRETRHAASVSCREKPVNPSRPPQPATAVREQAEADAKAIDEDLAAKGIKTLPKPPKRNG